MKTTTTIVAALALMASLATAEDSDRKKTRSTDAEIKKQQALAGEVSRADAPNVIHGRTATYRGACPQAKRLGNPLQLINPFAPMSKGSGELNVVPPMPGDKALGLSVVSVDF